MTTKNDITGDLLRSKPASDMFDKNFDQIDWSVKLEATSTTITIQTEDGTID
jgi:hypothetical protein